MNIAMGIKKMSSNLDELERRLKELQKVEATVGITNDGKHPNFDGSFHELMWMQHSGVSSKRIPPRPLGSISLLTFKGEDIMRKSLNKYFSNLDKKGGVISAEDTLKPWLKGMYEHSLNLFGNKTFLRPNAQFTIDSKGFNAPLVESGSLKAAWGVKINNVKVEL